MLLVSDRPEKKYRIKKDGKFVYFGQRGYQHFKDQTKFRQYKHLDHTNRARRVAFWKRMTGKDSKLKALREARRLKHWAKFYAIKYLW